MLRSTIPRSWIPRVKLYYFNARHYDPQIARFASADTVIDGGPLSTQGWNRYMYVRGNPIKYKDPTGHKSWNDYLQEEYSNPVEREAAREEIINRLVDNAQVHREDWEQKWLSENRLPQGGLTDKQWEQWDARTRELAEEFLDKDPAEDRTGGENDLYNVDDTYIFVGIVYAKNPGQFPENAGELSGKDIMRTPTVDRQNYEVLSIYPAHGGNSGRMTLWRPGDKYRWRRSHMPRKDGTTGPTSGGYSALDILRTTGTSSVTSYKILAVEDQEKLIRTGTVDRDRILTAKDFPDRQPAPEGLHTGSEFGINEKSVIEAGQYE